MCLFPKLIHNPKYRATKKNGGIIPPISDIRVKEVPIGCGKCIECLKQKANNWKTRLHEEVKKGNKGYFVTLTFDPIELEKLMLECNKKELKLFEDYDLDNRVSTLAVRRFLERWRKKFKKSVRHFFVNEIGGNNTEGLHLHGFIWTEHDPKCIREIWQYGWTYPDDFSKNTVENRTVNYVVKYILKVDTEHPNFRPKIFCSAGLGDNWADSHEAKKIARNKSLEYDCYRMPKGQKVSLPVYYRNKVYSEEDREKLWLERLDKNERYILGVKVKVDKGYEEYFEGLIGAREMNKRLGYGGDETDNDKLEYEKALRRLKQEEKIKKRNI